MSDLRQLKERAHTLVSVTLGDSDDVDHLVLREHIVDGNGLLQLFPGPVHLLADGSTIQLNLHQVGLLLPQGQQVHLNVKVGELAGKKMLGHPVILSDKQVLSQLDSTLTCVWAMMRMTLQYFFMEAKSFSSCFLPSSSCHFLLYLVKAFFLDLYLNTHHENKQKDKVGAQSLHNPTGSEEEGWAKPLARL